VKIKIVVVDLEIPPRAKRAALGIGLPIALLAGASAIAYAGVPKVWTAGEPLKAAELNQDLAGLDQRLSSLESAASTYAAAASVPALTPWTAYTPGFQTADGVPINNAQASGSYRRVGDTLEFDVVVGFTGQPTSSSSMYWIVTLPNSLAGLAYSTAYPAAVVGFGEAWNGTVNDLAVHLDGADPNHLFIDVVGTNGRLSTQSIAFGTGRSFNIRGAVLIAGWNITP
jgi:hypothetical protein